MPPACHSSTRQALMRLSSMQRSSLKQQREKGNASQWRHQQRAPALWTQVPDAGRSGHWRARAPRGLWVKPAAPLLSAHHTPHTGTLLCLPCFSCLEVHLVLAHLEGVPPSWQAADFEMSNCPFPAAVSSRTGPSFSVVPTSKSNGSSHAQFFFFKSSFHQHKTKHPFFREGKLYVYHFRYVFN